VERIGLLVVRGVIPAICQKELREITKTLLRTIGVLIDIQNGHLSNTSLNQIAWSYFLKTHFNIYICLSLKSISYLILQPTCLRNYATSQKVAGSSPDEVDFFQLT
jgi:hypothetical protein